MIAGGASRNTGKALIKRRRKQKKAKILDPSC